MMYVRCYGKENNMKFSTLFLIFVVIGVIVCIVAGPAAVLVWGVIFVLGITIAGEVQSTKTKEGREQMQREKQEEEDYVNYWGSVQYWDDLEEEREEDQEEDREDD